MSIIPITGTYRSETSMESRAEGLAEATTRSVPHILDRRGVAVSPAARAHITGCTDIDLAETWLDEALTATSTAELTGLDEA